MGFDRRYVPLCVFFAFLSLQRCLPCVTSLRWPTLMTTGARLGRDSMRYECVFDKPSVSFMLQVKYKIIDASQHDWNESSRCIRCIRAYILYPQYRSRVFLREHPHEHTVAKDVLEKNLGQPCFSPHGTNNTKQRTHKRTRAHPHTHAQPQRTSKGSANITGQTNASHTATIHGFSADRFPLPTPSRLCCTFQHDFSSFWLFASENHGIDGARHWWQAAASLRPAAARPIMLFCCTSDRVAALLSQACRACLQRSVFDATRL